MYAAPLVCPTRVLADRGVAHTRLGPGQPDLANRVVPQVAADGDERAPAEQARRLRVTHAPAEHEPVVELLELVALLGIVEEVGEVREQVQAVVDSRSP